MGTILGCVLFAVGPLFLAVVLFLIDRRSRRIRPASILSYVVIMAMLIAGALHLVAHIAEARVIWTEVVIVLWFTIEWRLGWAVWARVVGRAGQRWVRWGRLRRRSGGAVPLPIRLIPAGRAATTALVFCPLFLSVVVTHRCKLADGQDPMSVFGVPFESVRIPTRDGMYLDGWFVPERGAERTIVICHGAGANKGNFVWYLGPLLHRGYNVVFFDFRAHGGSDGRVTTYGIHERLDVLAAVEWLKRERPEQSRVIVGLGSSLGAMALALAGAEEPRIDALVLDSPFASPRELARDGAGRLPVLGPLAADWLLLLMSAQTGANFLTASAEQAVQRLGGRPVLVVHGDEDILMPAAHSRRIHEAVDGPSALWLGPGPHSNIITTDPSEYASRLFAFLDRHLGPAPLHPPARTRAGAPRTSTSPDTCKH